VGEKDEVNREASRYLNNEIKGSELHIISDIGHTVMIENPKKFNQILEGFIKTSNS
jgi:pimeloyl-ACP methyl ester carboxylesterase